MGRKIGITLAAVAITGFIALMIYAVGVEIKPVLSRKANKVPTISKEIFVEEGAEPVEPADYYKMDMSMYSDSGEDNTNSMYITFNQEAKTFAMWYSCQQMGSGTYELSNNEIIMNITSTKADEMRFLLDGGHLIQEDVLCAGDVPDEDTFDATFYQKSSSTTVYYYTFTKDGKFTLRQTVDDDENPKDISADGTYVRDGDVFNCTIGDFRSTPYLIYKGHLASSFYQEISAEQWEAEYKANEEAAQQ